MRRKIIKIDESACNGCGLCVSACHEGAIGLVNGKAKLLRDDYCDGLGNCLPVCPTGAITFEEREAPDYNETEVKKNMALRAAPAGGCPGAAARSFPRESVSPSAPAAGAEAPRSCLNQWPVQIKLVPVNAPYFRGADLLVAADCTAFARADFHSAFMAGKVTLIGCPKLDEGNYAEKLGAIFSANEIHSVTVARMEVPCCGGLEYAVKTALEASGKDIPLQVVTISIDGNIR